VGCVGVMMKGCLLRAVCLREGSRRGIACQDPGVGMVSGCVARAEFDLY